MYKIATGTRFRILPLKHTGEMTLFNDGLTDLYTTHSLYLANGCHRLHTADE